MALARPLFVGFSGASKVAREGGDLEVTVDTEEGPVTFTLPWFFVRDVDALLERWRREEHEATLLTMNDGLLEETLCHAAWAGGLRDTVFLLAQPGVDIEFARGDGPHTGWTALTFSVYGGHQAVTTVLLDAGAAGMDGATSMSASMGRTPTVALLLDRGANLHYEDDLPLQLASLGGHLETVSLLLDRGATVHALNDQALKYARRYGYGAVVALLLERGAGAD